MGYCEARILHEEDKAMARESRATDLIAMFRGIIAARRDPCYMGGVTISDDQIRELANACAMNVIASYEVTEIR